MILHTACRRGAGGVAGEREVRLAAATALGAVARRSSAAALAAAAPALLSGPPPAVAAPASTAAATSGADAAPAPPPTPLAPAVASLGTALGAAVADARFATVRRAGLEVAVCLREVMPAATLAAALGGVPAPGGGSLLALIRSAAAVDRDAAAKELGRRAVAGL